jgi:glutamine---fructose-6-phosphate transaminase (isomerizing)
MGVPMCGIVGYIGSRQAVPIILEGLKRLEYRGYDSAGIATIGVKDICVRRVSGKVSDLEKVMPLHTDNGTLAIGHTRWATHGEPTERNAHPHKDCTQKIALVHNGIIENYQAIRTKLEQVGHIFTSDTDTEVLVHLIEEISKITKDLTKAVRLALKEVDGAYGIAVISVDEPDKIIVARKGSPLVIGIGDGEQYLASDAAALVRHTRKVVYLEDGELAVLSKSGFVTKTIDNVSVEKQIHQLTFDIEQIEKAGYPHFMLKEIHEQPLTITDALRGRILLHEGNVKLGGLADVVDHLRTAKRFIITACGTSWHAGLVGEYMLEQYARIPVEVEYASEFRYRNPIISEGDVVWAISQSGETADTFAAVREARQRGARVFGIVNVVGSTIARETDSGVYIHAGPEIGVASTKAFTSQLTVLTLITILMARLRGMSSTEAIGILSELKKIPDKVASVLSQADAIKEIADRFSGVRNFLYLGRGYNFPVALEGALKLKEISYIHAEGYPAAEMKHGPIALIDDDMPAVVIAPKDASYDKVLSNIQEVKARRGKVIAVANDTDDTIQRYADHVIRIPSTLDMLSPIVASIPLQLLAYYIAVNRGCNVDQPRNLAKSVTVE